VEGSANWPFDEQPGGTESGHPLLYGCGEGDEVSTRAVIMTCLPGREDSSRRAARSAGRLARSLPAPPRARRQRLSPMWLMECVGLMTLVN